MHLLTSKLKQMQIPTRSTLHNAVSDGTNDANAVTYTITVTDVVIDIAAASATIDETVANGFSVVQLSSTGDSTNTGFSISKW